QRLGLDLLLRKGDELLAFLRGQLLQQVRHVGRVQAADELAHDMGLMTFERLACRADDLRRDAVGGLGLFVLDVVLEIGGPQIRHGRAAVACASTTASALILTMPRTDTVGVRICAGWAAPIRIGPTDVPSPTPRNRLSAMLAASRVGMISRFACPLRPEL